MKEFVWKLSCFLLLSSLIYCSALYFAGSSRYASPYFSIKYNRGGHGHTYSRLLDAGRTAKVDILFVGTSLTFRGYDTRIFESEGINAFNLGTPGETPLQAELLLKKFLKNIKPKLVVYEINPEWFNNLGKGSALDIISNLQSIDFYTLQMVYKMGDVDIFNTFLFSSLKNYMDSDPYKEPFINNKEVYIKGGGYVESPIKYYTPKKIERRVQGIQEKQFSAFLRCLEILKEKDIEVLLVRPPVTNSLYHSFLNNKELDSIFSKEGSYFNFNQMVKLNDSIHFSDLRHLNQYGVITYNNFFIDFLKEKQLIEN